MTVQIGDIVGDYKVVDTAGAGGMGTVYKIEHVITKRIEAMKILPAGISTDPEQLHRFEREIQVQARLHHPNIAALYNAVRDDRSIALIMEFVEGVSLLRMLEAGPLPLKTTLDYVCQVLSALAYAHDEGVIHRDVTPANILITPDRIAKLTDFGLARPTADLSLTTTGVPMGSPWYMSPEQVRGIGVIDARTDIYAVGAVLYELLTGVKVFPGDGAFEVMRAQMETLPTPPSSRDPRIPPAIDEIVLKALAKDPQMRFQSAGEFRLALERSATVGLSVVVPARTAPRPAAPPLAARLRAYRPSRTAVMAAAVPVLLAASFLAVRFFPKPAKVQASAPVSHGPAAVLPAAPAVPLTPPEPAGAIPAAPLAPAASEPAVAPQQQVAAQPAAPAKRRPVAKPQQSYAIRVSGGEVESSPVSSALPPPLPANRSATAPPPVVTKPALEPEVAPAAAAPTVPAMESKAQEPVVKPAKPGNRLVKALGRINPFRKGSKDDATDASKPAAKKDQ